MKRKVFSVILALTVALSALFVVSFARDYSNYEKVDITAKLSKDGTMAVTEKWKITYVGSSDGFVRPIDAANLPSYQKYDKITDVKVTVDNVALTESSTGNVDTYSSGLSSDGNSFNINISSPSQDQTKTYEISYNVSGVVKKDGKKARVCFLFLGNTFTDTANNIDITVSLPSAVSSSDIIFPDGAQENVLSKDDNGNVKYKVDTGNKVIGVDFYVPATTFNESSLGSVSSFSDWFSVIWNKYLKIALPICLFVVAAVLIFWLVLGAEKRKRRKLEKEVNKSVSADENTPSVLPEGYTSVEAYKILVPYNRARPKKTTQKVPMLFALAVLECIDSGYVIGANGELQIVNNGTNAPAYLRSALNFLATFADVREGRYLLNDNFYKNVKKECSENYDVIGNYISSFYDLIPDTDNKFFKDEDKRETYKKLYLLKYNAEKVKAPKNYTSCVEKVLTGTHPYDPDIYSMMFSNKNGWSFFSGSSSESIKSLSYAMNEIAEVFIARK